MYDSKTAHRFKNKESGRRSTHCRADDSLDADKVSHPDSHRHSPAQRNDNKWKGPPCGGPWGVLPPRLARSRTRIKDWEKST
jgi:hypothetical protein